MNCEVVCPTCSQQCQIEIPSGLSSLLVCCPSCQNQFEAEVATPPPQAAPVQATPVQATPVQAAPVHAVPGQQHQRVEVVFAGAPMRADVDKREYSFQLIIGGAVVHQFQGTFSDLRTRFNSLLEEFPSRHVMQNFKTNEANVARRAEELRIYFEQKLNQRDEGRIVGSAAVHAALTITSQVTMQAFNRVASARKAAANAARAQVAARQAAIQQQQLADCRHAQDFNQLVAYTNIAPGQLSTITFPTQQRFELRNRWWGWGDANIRGPGGHPWFMMERTNASMFGEMFKNCQFQISTMRGEPLLMLQENFRFASYEYDLFRIDPRSGQPIPVCKIVREWGANFMRVTDQYQVQLFPAAAAHGMVHCSGRWPNQFTLGLNGMAVATVDKEMFTFNDKYNVEIAPNVDVLLFIGIACAIDRIHHEVEDNRR